MNPQWITKIISVSAFSVLLISFSTSCQLFQKDTKSETPKSKTKKPRKLTEGIGVVVSINTDEQFVLIDVSKPKLASKATFFYIEKGSRQAVVNPTGEKIGHYYAADIVSGKVSLGDSVLVKLPKPPVVEEKSKTVEEELPVSNNGPLSPPPVTTLTSPPENTTPPLAKEKPTSPTILKGNELPPIQPKEPLPSVPTPKVELQSVTLPPALPSE